MENNDEVKQETNVEVDGLKVKHSTSLTSIKIFKDKYTAFKGVANVEEFTLQKLVNRSIHLYLTDTEFRKKLTSTTDLQASGSSF